LPVYTSIDMLDDCRAGKVEGWKHLIAEFLPALEWILCHYEKDKEERRRLMRGLLASMRSDPDSPVNRLRSATDREFLYHAAGYLLAAAGPGAAPTGDSGDLPAFRRALEPLTRLERQIVWFAALGYDEAEIGEVLPAAPTIPATLRRARELLAKRGVDLSCRQRRKALIAAVRADRPKEPVPLPRLFQMLDGQIGWKRRDALEERMVESWYELDRFCRALEAAVALRRKKPLPAAQAAEFLDSIGIGPGSRGGATVPRRARTPGLLRLLPFRR